MAAALALARRAEGLTAPNPPVGAVVVRAGRLQGSGFHRAAGEPHAEVEAIREAGSTARGATLYVTLEPCSTHGRTPPCTDAVRQSGIRHVVIGTRDPNPAHRGRGVRLLRKAGIRVTENVLETEARELVAPFAKHVTTGRPFVTLKLGLTLDGRIADRNGRSRWITGAASRDRVHDLRRRVDAILVGRGSACTDDPALIARNGRHHVPWRVVADSRGSLPLSARLLSDPWVDRTIVATTRRCRPRRIDAYRNAGARVWRLPSTRPGVSLSGLLDRLGRMGVLHVLCEGGGELAAALLRGRFVDRCWLFLAPRLLGGSGTPAVGGRGWTLGAAPEMRILAVERVGEDVLVKLEP